MQFLSQYGSDKHKEKVDKYWDEKANDPNGRAVVSAIAEMPLKHLRTVVANTNHDMFVRQLAASTFRNKKAAGYPE